MRKSILGSYCLRLNKVKLKNKIPILARVLWNSGYITKCMFLRYGCQSYIMCPDMFVLLTPGVSPTPGRGLNSPQSLCWLSAEYTAEKKVTGFFFFFLLLVMKPQVRVHSFNCYQNGESHIILYITSFKVLHYCLSYLIPYSSVFISLSSTSWCFWSSPCVGQ